MHIRLPLLALAALSLAAPAAAQPDPAQILAGAVEQLAANAGGAEDYTLVVAQGDDRAEVFVHRRNGTWEVETQETSFRATLLGMGVVWPAISNPGELAILPENAHALRYLGTEAVDGRTAHVVSGIFGSEPPAEQPDTSLIYVDAETRQVLRMHFAGQAAPGADGMMPDGPEKMSLTIALADYRETDGVTAPRRLQLSLRMEMEEMDAEEIADMRKELAELREMEGMDSPEMREFLEVMEFFGQLMLTGRLDLDVAVEEVRVNTGPPAWVLEQEAEEGLEEECEDCDP